MERLPIAPVARILTNNGARRASKDAKIALADKLTEIGESIAEESIKIAEHSGRKTIQASDIQLALKLKF